MKKKVALATTALVLSAGFVAAPATAAPANDGAACAQAGITYLKENGLFEAAVKKQIDYSDLADVESGPIFASLEPGSNLSLGQVVKLHTKAPSAFLWCR